MDKKGRGHGFEVVKGPPKQNPPYGTLILGAPYDSYGNTGLDPGPSLNQAESTEPQNSWHEDL